MCHSWQAVVATVGHTVATTTGPTVATTTGPTVATTTGPTVATTTEKIIAGNRALSNKSIGIGDNDMAFQMIPPRVSSSPPPLDSLPSVACTGDEDDDDEFGNFASHSTFDITGLSDKLPPTPEVSPSKHPIVRASGGDDSRSDETTRFNGPTVEAETLPRLPDVSEESSEIQLKSPLSGINGEHSGSLEIVDQDDDFGDFNFASSATPDNRLTDVSVGERNDGEEAEESGISSSQKCSLGPEVPDSSPSNSVHSFSMIATPPPLDHVVDSVVVDDEFSRISPNPPSAKDEDEFGDFATCTLEETKNSVNPVSDIEGNVEVKEPTIKGCSKESSEIGDRKDGDTWNSEKCDESTIETTNRTKKCNIISSDITEGEHCEENSVSDTNKGEDDSECARDDPIQSQIETISSECSLPGLEMGESLDKFSKAEPSVAQSVDAPNDFGSKSCHLELETDAKEELNEPSACTSSEEINFRTEPDVDSDPKKDVDSVTESDYRDTNGDEFECDFDFGNFAKAEGDDDDDLDFDDLREQVKSGKFGMGDSIDADEDFGDFYEYNTGSMAPQEVLDDNDEPEFGNFGSATAENEDDDDFGDFAQVEPKDDFGDLAAPEGPVSEKDASIEVEHESDNANDVSEFGDFTSQQCVINQSEPFKTSWHDQPCHSSKDTKLFRKAFNPPVPSRRRKSATNSTLDSFDVAKENAALQWLESLILKWIPKEKSACSSFESQENHIVPTLFQSVEDDAFVWRQLENLEASAALTLSWGSTQAQTLYLSSVNVDARNILFGQKWSSSVPLFAQTLSFSPLTPAKPTESCGSLEAGGNRGSASPPVLAPGVSPKFTASFQRDRAERETSVDSENSQEEQIPPANFDWTSSGLTNPLEGPAYNSSLFDMDILLSNSDIGKGATNALLASLEREFLSEGGEKGSAGQMQTPPAPSPLVQQILDSRMNSSQATSTPLQSLSSNIREVVEHLPKIGFMRSRVLMFPIRGDN